MGEKVLVESKVADSVKLIQELDAGGKAPSLAAWYYYDDANEWRLLLAGPAFGASLPKQEAVAYGYLVEAMASLSLSSLTISDLKLVDTNEPLPQALHSLIRTESDEIARASLTNITLNGIFIKEMILLRSA